MDEGGFFAADERACAELDLKLEIEAAAEDVLAEEAFFLSLGDGVFEALHRERVLGTDIDDAVVRADRVAADGHGFEDGVRVAFEHGAVHERARVAFVGVADDELFAFGLGGRERPFLAGGEARAAASAEVGSGDHVDDVLGLHGGDDLREGGIAAFGDVLVDIFGIDAAGVAEDDARLEFAFGGGFVFGIVPAAVDGVGAGGRSFEAGLHDGGDLVRGHVAVDDALALVVGEHDDGLGVAEAHAADFDDVERAVELVLGDVVVDGLQDFAGTGGDTARSHGNEQFDGRVLARLEGGRVFSERRRRVNSHIG